MAASGGINVATLNAVVTADTGDFDGKMDSAGQKVTDFGTKTQGATTSAANFGGASTAMAAGAVGIAAGLADSIMAAGDFQQTVNEIGAVSGATAAELAQLSNVALQVGKDTAFSAQEGAQAISELSKAGVAIPDILNGAAMATANLAAAAGVDMPRAAEIMSNAMNMFQIAGADASDVADILAGAANTSAASINDLALGMAQAGPSAVGLGMSLEEVSAALALFADRGLSGSDAGTSLKTMLASLTPATKPAREAFAELGLSATESGNAFFDLQGNFVGMEQASDVLYNALKDLTDQQRAQYLETIFGSDASRAAELMFQAQKSAVEGTGRGYDSYLEAVQASGQATDVANAKMAGMKGALEALSGSIETAQIAFGMAFLPAVEIAAEGLATLVNAFIALPSPVQNVISFVTAGAAAFLAVGSAIGFLLGPLGAFVGALAPVAVGIAAIAAPLALVTAGIAALYIAYQTNFLGFADGVNAAAALVAQGFNNLVLLAQNVATAFGEGGLGAALQVLSDAFLLAFQNLSTTVQTGLQGASDAAMAWLNTMGANLETGWATIQAGAAAGWSLITGAITAAWALIQSAVGAGISAVSLAVQAGWSAISGGVAAAWAIVTAAISGAWDTITSTVSTKVAEVGSAVQTKFGEISSLIPSAMQDIQTAVTTGWETIKTEVGTRIDGIKTDVGAKWAEIGADLTAKGAEIQTAATSAWDGIKSAITTKVGEIQTDLQGKWDGLKTDAESKVGELQASLSSTWDTIKADATSKIEDLKTEVLGKWDLVRQETVNKVDDLKSTLFTTFDTIKTDVPAKLDEMKTSAVEKFETLKTDATATIDGLKTSVVDAATDLATSAVEQFETLKADATAKVDELKTSVETSVSDLKTAAVQTVTDLATEAVSQFEVLKADALVKAQELKDGFIEQMNNLKTEALNAVSGLKDAIVGYFADAGTWLVDAGKNIGQGLIDGLGSMVGSVRDAAGNLAGAAADAATSMLGIRSPSTVFHGYGVDTATGFAQGIESGTGEVAQAVVALIERITGVVSDRLGGLSSGFKEGGQRAGKGIVAGMDEATADPLQYKVGSPEWHAALRDKISASMGDIGRAAGKTLKDGIDVTANLDDLAQQFATLASFATADLSSVQKAFDLVRNTIDESGTSASKMSENLTLMAQELSQLGLNDLASDFDQLATEIADAGGAVSDDFLAKIADLSAKVPDALQDVSGAFGRFGELAGDDIARGMGMVLDQILQALKRIGDILARQFGDVGTSSADALTTAVNDGISDNESTFQKRMLDMIDGGKKKGEESGKLAKTVGATVVDAVNTGVGEKELDHNKTMIELVDGGIKEGEAKGDDADVVGASIVDATTKGINDNRQDVITAASKMIVSAIEEMAEQAKKAFDVGKDLVAGFIQGMQESLEDARTKGGDLGKAASDGLASSLEAQSPSQVTRRLGGDFASGFGIGMTDGLLGVQTAAQTLGASAGESLRNAISQAVSEDIDIGNVNVGNVHGGGGNGGGKDDGAGEGGSGVSVGGGGGFEGAGRKAAADWARGFASGMSENGGVGERAILDALDRLGVTAGAKADASGRTIGKGVTDGAATAIADGQKMVFERVDQSIEAATINGEKVAGQGGRAMGSTLMRTTGEGITETRERTVVRGSMDAIDLAVDQTMPVAKQGGTEVAQSYMTNMEQGVQQGAGEVQRQSTDMMRQTGQQTQPIAREQGKGVGQEFSQFAAQGIKAGERDVSQAGKGIMDGAGREAQRDANRLGRQAGDDLGRGVAEGIRGRRADVEREARDIIKAAADAANQQAQNRSPSRLFRGIAHDVVDGFILGMDDRSGDVARAAAAMIGIVSDATIAAAQRAMAAMSSVPETDSFRAGVGDWQDYFGERAGYGSYRVGDRISSANRDDADRYYELMGDDGGAVGPPPRSDARGGRGGGPTTINNIYNLNGDVRIPNARQYETIVERKARSTSMAASRGV